MGRKPITPSQRSIPVSFSVKPVLADRIEQMAYDQRFTRSRFLSEAVLRYINFIEMGGLEGSENVADMTLGRRVLIGTNALQEANRENEPLPEPIMKQLRKQLDLYELNQVERIPRLSDSLPEPLPIKTLFFEKTQHSPSTYAVYNWDEVLSDEIETPNVLGIITKQKNNWLAQGAWSTAEYKTLKDAKADIKSYFGVDE